MYWPEAGKSMEFKWGLLVWEKFAGMEMDRV